MSLLFIIEYLTQSYIRQSTGLRSSNKDCMQLPSQDAAYKTYSMEAKQISDKMASVQKNLLTSEQIEVQFTLKMNEIKMNHISMANTQTHRG